VSQGDRLERGGLAEEGELEAEEMLKRMGIKVVEEDEELEDEGEVDRRVTLEAEAQSLARGHGRCRAAYILRAVYGLEPRVIARLLNANPSTVRNCIAYYAKRERRVELLPPLEAFKRYKELCRDVYSLECQSLEAEAFAYAMARWAAPATLRWSIYVRAASIHRIVFPEVYATLQEYARAAGLDFRKLLRAHRPRGSSWWVAGDGVIAYAYTLLELAHYTLGYKIYGYSEKLREAVRELTGKPRDPLGQPITPITMLVAFKLNTLYPSSWDKVLVKERELESELLRAARERKGRAASSRPP